MQSEAAPHNLDESDLSIMTEGLDRHPVVDVGGGIDWSGPDRR